MTSNSSEGQGVMPAIDLVSTGCAQDDNALYYLPPHVPNTSLVFARVDVDRLNDEPRRGESL